MNKFVALLLLCGVILVSYTACKKKKDDDTVVPVEEEFVPDFKVMGHPYVNERLRFISNYTDSKEMTWEFGDNNKITIAGIQTEHSYKKPGTYPVTMSVAGTDVVVTKTLHITSGAQRFSGNHRWNFFLKLYKKNFPQNLIPPSQFHVDMTVNIIGDSTIIIPAIPNMRFIGPDTVKLVETSEKDMIFRSKDLLTELSYNFAEQRGGMKVAQSSSDTSWQLDGFADIFK